MEIIGNREFKLNTKKALNLIKDKIPLWYSNVEYNISRIIQNDITFLYPYEDISYFVSDDISSSNLVLYASIILREAYHAFLVNQYLSSVQFGNCDCYDGREQMRKYYDIQKLLIIKLGGTDEMIEYINLEYKNKINEVKNEISIVGNNEFNKKIRNAIECLRINDNVSYEIVISNIKRIVQFSSSSITYYDRFQDVPTVFMNDYELSISLIELCSDLVHEACHINLYKEADGKENPETTYHGYDAEMYCLERQIECLKTLGAPNDMIEAYNSFYGTKWWDKTNDIKYTRKC